MVRVGEVRCGDGHTAPPLSLEKEVRCGDGHTAPLFSQKREVRCGAVKCGEGK